MPDCLNCSRPLGKAPPSAPGKKFCSAACRQQWHGERRKAAMRLLAEAGPQAADSLLAVARAYANAAPTVVSELIAETGENDHEG